MKEIKWVICLLVLASGCKKANLTPDEYKDWMKGNSAMHRTKEIDVFKYTVDVVPAEWIAYTNLFPKNNFADYTKKLEETAGMNYFRLTIDVKGNGANVLKYDMHKESDYFERLYYVSYLMKDDIKVTANDKDYPCILYSYERAYDLNSKLSFMLGFAKPEKPGSDIIIDIVPAGLNADHVKLKFKDEVFESSPKLLLE